MTGVIASLPKFQFSNALGLPMSGGTLTSYLAGTTTPATTYQDQALATANTNPISLDSRGECMLWLDSTKTYKFVLKNAAGVIQWTADNIINAQALVDQLRTDLAAPAGSSLVGYMPAGVGAVATDVQNALRQRVSLFGFMTEAQRSDVSAGTALLDVTDAVRTAFIVAKWASTGNFDIQQHSRGMTVNAPPGRYRVNGEIPMFAGLHFCGSGSNATVFVQESTTSNTFAFLNDEGGTADPIVLADFAVVQKLGVAPTSGYAIFADKPAATPDRATALTLRNVFTQDTWGGVYVDWCFTSNYTSVITNRHTNGIVLGYYNTSSVFNACMGNACVNSGFKIAGTYITFNACEANANGRDGFEVYSPSGVLNRNISFVSPGAENNGRHQISVSKSSGTTILTPHMVGLTAGDSPMMLSDTTGTFISGFDASVPAANANPALKLNNTGGAYPIGTTLMADSFVSANYASPVSDSDRVYWLDSDAQVGAYKGTFRFGTKTRYVKDAQKLYQGSPLPTTVVSSWARMLPEANQAYTQATGYSIKFSVNAPAATVAVLQAGLFIEVPTIIAGTVTRYEGTRIADMPAGGSADANLVLGDATVPVGRWSIFNPSTKDNLFYGPVRWGSSTGPVDAFGAGTPEGTVTAVVGSTFRRTNGGVGASFYVKESGTGNTGWVAK
jgi:hypothetical protein